MVWHFIKWHTGCQRIFAIIQILTDSPVSDIIKEKLNGSSCNPPYGAENDRGPDLISAISRPEPETDLNLWR